MAAAQIDAWEQQAGAAGREPGGRREEGTGREQQAGRVGALAGSSTSFGPGTSTGG